MTNTYWKTSKIRSAIAIVIILCTLAAGFATAVLAAERVYAMQADETTSVAIGELLLSDYDTASDAAVFDGDTFAALVAALRNEAETKSEAAVKDLSAKDAAAIRALNEGKDIVVTMDGKQWTVTDLRKLEDGRVIATMWLAATDETEQWNLWGDTNNPLYTYPSNMYSTSYIRADALNSGGCGYVATEGDASSEKLTQIAQNAAHPYAKFTMREVKTDAANADRNLSLIQYLVQPQDVAYQETETILQYSTSWNTCPNEAWGTPAKEQYNPNMNYKDKPGYTEWKSDYLWLPSLAEVGYNASPEVSGIWNLSQSQRSNGTDTWFRSGYYEYSHRAIGVTAKGEYFYTNVTEKKAVRPAFHLDLTRAESAAQNNKVAVPTIGASEADRSQDYTGAELTFALSKYDATTMRASVSGKDAAGNAISADSIKWDAQTGQITAKYAGTYTVELHLTDSEKIWGDATGGTDKRTATFVVAPKELTVSLTNTVPSSAWSWTVGSSYEAKLTVSGIVSGDTVSLCATYTSDKAGGVKKDIAAVQNGTGAVATIDLSEISVGSYTLTAALDAATADNDNLNYSLKQGLASANMPKKFTVTAKSISEDDLKGFGWLYTAKDQEGNKIAGGADDSALPEGNKIGYALYKTATGSAAVVYEMSVDKSTFPKGANGNALIGIDELNTSYTGGYIDRSGYTVGSYTTKVLLKTLSDDYAFAGSQKTHEISLQWEIVKGKFDLTKVKWEYVKAGSSTATEYSKAVEYHDGKNITVRVKSNTLPLGLTVGEHAYSGHIQNAVGKYVAENAELHYDTDSFEAPTAGVKLNWEITAKQIPINWKSVARTNDYGKKYYTREISGDAYQKYIVYKYYDASGKELTGGLADIDAIDVGTQIQTFTVVATLVAGTTNYVLADNARTTFQVGDGKVLATPSFAGDGRVTYDKQSHFTSAEIRWKIDGDGAIGTDDYTIAYYKGTDLTDMSKNTLLNAAPTDAGDYVIVITLRNGAEDSYVLDGEAYAVHILPKAIAVPTVKTTTFNGAAQRLSDLIAGFDADNMTLDGDLAATAAGTYRATIELTSANYVWETDADEAADRTIVWTIAKAQIEEYWSNASGKPTFVIPSKYAAYVQVVYQYIDADGNVVAEADLVVGQQYKIVAKLSGAGADNFEITDADGNVLDVPTQSNSKVFTYGQTGDPNNPDRPNTPTQSGGDGETLANAKWFRAAVFAVVGLLSAITLLMLLMWITMLSIRRLRKKQTKS